MHTLPPKNNPKSKGNDGLINNIFMRRYNHVLFYWNRDTYLRESVPIIK